MKPNFVNLHGLSFSISKSLILQPFWNEKSSLSIYCYRHCTHFLLAWEARNLWGPQDTRYKTTCIHVSHSFTPLAIENNNLLLHLSLSLSLSNTKKMEITVEMIKESLKDPYYHYNGYTIHVETPSSPAATSLSASGSNMSPKPTTTLLPPPPRNLSLSVSPPISSTFPAVKAPRIAVRTTSYSFASALTVSSTTSRTLSVTTPVSLSETSSPILKS